MGLKKVILVPLVLIFIQLPVNAHAAWSGLTVVLSGSFGSLENQFGISSSETVDDLPELLNVMSDGRLLVWDTVQGKTKVYTKTGVLIKHLPYIGGKVEERSSSSLYAFKLVVPERALYAGAYDIEGGEWLWVNNSVNFLNRYNLFVAKSGADFVAWRGKGYRISPSGEIINDYSEKPVELGVVKSFRELSEVGYEGIESTIKIGDTEFTAVTPSGIDTDSLRQDQTGFIYGTGRVETAGDDWPWKYRVFRFDTCGKTLAMLNMPVTNTEEINHSVFPYQGEAETIFLEEYGPPVIGPDGSVYAWKRTPDTYSILKWEWVDDPSDPQPGPETPGTFMATPSTAGVYLSWNASPQDPGCVESYDIERSAAPDGTFDLLKTVDKGTVSYDDTSAISGTTWYYRVKAKAGEMESDYSPVTSATKQ